MQKEIKYTVSPEMHQTLVDFFSRLDINTVNRVLSTPRGNEVFSKEEREIKEHILFQFYFQELLHHNPTK